MPTSPSQNYQAVVYAENAEIAASRTVRLGPQPAIAPPPLGLAFSGGGIRSATFNLGILLGLEKAGLLKWFDYLSTVSGGGYIGSWLLASLANNTFRTASTRERAIHHLRKYSNYLAPQTGFLSADLWTMAIIWLRNTMLVQVTLFMFLAILLLLPRLSRAAFFYWDSPGDASWLSPVAKLSLVLPTILIAKNLWKLRGQANPPAKRPYSQTSIQLLVATSMLLAATTGAGELWAHVNEFAATYSGTRSPGIVELWPVLSQFGFVPVAVTGVLMVFSLLPPPPKKSGSLRLFGALVTAILSTTAGLALLYPVTKLFLSWVPRTDDINRAAGSFHAAVWGPPIFILIYSLVVVLQIGLLGRALPDDRREWWSRLGAWLGIYAFGILALKFVALYGPLLLASVLQIGGEWARGGLTAGWILTTISGLFAAKSDKTGKIPRTVPETKNRFAAAVSLLAPYVFIAGVIVLLAGCVHLVLAQFISIKPGSDPFLNRLGEVLETSAFPSANSLTLYHWVILEEVPVRAISYLLAFCGALLLLLAWRVDINEFSLNHFYRNRLVRCYLGAARAALMPSPRTEHPFTGFDFQDEVPLSKLRPSATPAYSGPLPIINTALNLAPSADLALQQRRADSFVFTPVYSGSDRTGYRPTDQYIYPGCGMRLGTAVCISGAAASPNAGFHTSTAASFLLTLFNVRLGWWVPHPGKESWKSSGPAFSMRYLLLELFGSASDDVKFLNLSDGGHFENLGVYELVRRRCRLIVVGDGEQDENLTFESLGGVIRKCRIDFNVKIEIDVAEIGARDANRSSRAHCAIGRICYQESAPGAADEFEGTLLYLKSSLTGDEDRDVLQYAASSEAFPHESTADQFFSESQFESYRKLGEHVCETALRDVKTPGSWDDVPAFALALRQKWYSPSKAPTGAFAAHAGELSKIWGLIRTDPQLQFLDDQIFPEWQQLIKATAPHAFTRAGLPNFWLPSDPAQLRKGFFLCNSVIQLMENVYLDLRLDAEDEHPDNRGWINLFRHWSWSGMFRVTWAISSPTYGARFERYCEQRLGLERGKREVTSIVPPGELNFYEINELAKFNPGNVYQFNLKVADPRDPAKSVTFPFGLASVTGNNLDYFRIQDHVRGMGLGRWALTELRSKVPAPRTANPAVEVEERVARWMKDKFL